MRKTLVLLGLLVAGIAVYVTQGPYVYPTSMALGPCFKDWTSPTSYSPRVSPMEQVRFRVGEVNAQVCYSRPSARGRALFGADGALVRHGRLWRMGANEPTLLFIDQPMRLGSVYLDPGRYALYAEPDSASWEVIVSTSTFHWGNQISQEVRAQEVGQTTVPVDSVAFVEDFLIEPLPDADDTVSLRVAWGNTAVHIPLSTD
ncbi:MAG: hypothetical protein RhofKO_22310 [Rhodothermales bacterium]